MRKMATKKKPKKKYKRIHNPLTGKYYLAEIQPDGRYKIVGLWHPPKKKSTRKKGSIWDLLG
ncbi:hypothetical protein FH039_08780 [Thermococcus indicus]|uniref:Uncharacterized protein n=1 Tax=Thermococcus indicus TaxID=2586643 RepID=A0A4Y5SL96_9EURY|nr:hypothetical protein [Thermococcus indicus]QDA31673.1 hypothetical protein FH039_08780 [Thermococcus indicus]